MTTTSTNELTNGANGRWLGSSPRVRGIFRHHVPAVEDINPEPGEVVFHTFRRRSRIGPASAAS